MLPNVLQTSATDHVPVLADEVRELLAVQPGETVVDATFGAGGHAALLAADLQGSGKLIAIDRDPERRAVLRPLAKQRARRQTRFLRGDFSVVLEQLADNGVERGRDPARPRRLVDADRPARARLLVRGRRAARHADGSVRGRDRARASSTRRPSASSRRSSAATARSATRARSRGRSCAARQEQPFERTGDLVETIKAAIPAPARFGDGHPAKRVFQALRIAVNDELGALEARAAGRVRDAAARRPARRDQLPLARGPDRQALHARPRARLRHARRTSRCASAARRPSCARPRGRRSGRAPRETAANPRVAVRAATGRSQDLTMATWAAARAEEPVAAAAASEAARASSDRERRAHGRRLSGSRSSRSCWPASSRLNVAVLRLNMKLDQPRP